MAQKREVTILIKGLRMTNQRHGELGQAIMNTLNLKLDGETDGVTIAFHEEY